MSCIRTLHVGLGGRGAWAWQQATPERGFQPVGVVARTPASVAAVRARWPGIAEAADLASALATIPCDAVVICTPTPLHVPMALQAIAAGKAVLLEKGMAPDLASATTLVDAARSTGVPVVVAQNYRHQAMERTVARLLSDPTHPDHVGLPHLISANHHRVRPVPANLTYPYASIWDMSCHHLDTMLAWLGPGLAVVAARGERAPWSAYGHPSSTVAALLRHRSGCLVQYLHTHEADAPEVRIRIHAQHGTVWVDGQQVRRCAKATANWAAPVWQEVAAEAPLGELGVLEDFRRYLCDGREPGISAGGNLEVMRLCDDLVRACAASA